MTSGRRYSWGLVAATLLLSGCATYQYMRDSSPDIEKSRRDYVYNNPGNSYNDEIGDGRIRDGMSRLQVRVTWGDPDRIVTNGANTETWAYDETETSRGTAVYNLRFDGELLTHVEIERAALQLQTNAPESTKNNPDDKDVRPPSSVKPGS
jgi:outer membrane protein assembly factor BamE (lipoprotein component of BamABCDE complex)